MYDLHLGRTWVRRATHVPQLAQEQAPLGLPHNSSYATYD
jgi:hypothetical protein